MLKKKKKNLFKKNIKVKNSSISTLVLSSTFHLFLSLSLSLHFAVLSHFTSEIEIEIEILLSCSSPKVKESQLLLLVSVNPLTLSQILCLCNFFIFFLHQKKVSLICEIGDNLFWFVFFFFNKFLVFWFVYMSKISLLFLCGCNLSCHFLYCRYLLFNCTNVIVVRLKFCVFYNVNSGFEIWTDNWVLPGIWFS